jgi:predicted kinase
VAELETYLFVLVGGWPGSGKSTLAAGLARELALPLLAKDELKEAFSSGLGYPQSVERSRWMGQVAVRMMLRAAAGCPGAVLDSTWFEYSRPLVAGLPGTVVEVHCQVSRDLARERYQARMPGRSGVHVDALRADDELWGQSFEPLRVGPVVEVDTAGDVDRAQVIARIHAAAASARA